MKREVVTEVGLVIGIPTLGRPLCIEWANAFKALNPPINYNTRLSQVFGRRVADARNMIAESAVQQDAKYLFFLGDDVVVPPHTLKQLIYRLEHHPEIGIVSGVYCSKSKPSFPLVFRGNGAGPYWNWKIGEFFEVTGVGMDCALIRTDIFKKIPKPWFNTIDEDSYLDGVNKAEQWTEDLFFCNQVIELTDYKIFVDATVICEHWDSINRVKYTLPHDSYPAQPIDKKTGNKVILDLGSGGIRWDFEGEGTAITVDIREEAQPDYRCDLRQLPFDNESSDVVFSSHVIEHFGRWEVDDLMKEWIRVLKSDGELRTIIPNIAWAAKKILDDDVDYDTLNVLYGEQTYEYNFHKNGFTPKTFKELMEKHGLEVKSVDTQGYNIIVRAFKSGGNG